MMETQGSTHWRESLHPAVHEGVARLAESARGVFADAVESLVIFGSAAGTSFDPSRELAQGALVLRAIDIAGLRRLACDIPGLRRQRVASPLIMTPAYIAESLDTFPLEYLEIKQQHVSVSGGDPFASLDFRPADMRRQCERETKVLLIALRQGLLASGGVEDDLVDLDHDIAAALLRTLRGVLWLTERREVRTSEEILLGVEELLSRPLTGLRRALKAEVRERWDEFVCLYEDVSAVGRSIDALPTK